MLLLPLLLLLSLFLLPKLWLLLLLLERFADDGVVIRRFALTFAVRCLQLCICCGVYVAGACRLLLLLCCDQCHTCCCNHFTMTMMMLLLLMLSRCGVFVELWLTVADIVLQGLQSCVAIGVVCSYSCSRIL